MAAGRHAVADRGGHGDDHPAEQAADHARQRRVHAGGHDQHPHRPQLVEPAHQPPQSRHAHVGDQGGVVAGEAKRALRLARHRHVRGAGGDQRHLGRAAQRRRRPGPGGAGHRVVVQRRTRGRRQRVVAGGIEAGQQHRRLGGLQDRGDLGGGLAGAEHRPRRGRAGRCARGRARTRSWRGSRAGRQARPGLCPWTRQAQVAKGSNDPPWIVGTAHRREPPLDSAFLKKWIPKARLWRGSRGRAPGLPWLLSRRPPPAAGRRSRCGTARTTPAEPTLRPAPGPPPRRATPRLPRAPSVPAPLGPVPPPTPAARTRQRTVAGRSAAATRVSAACTMASSAGSMRRPVSMRLDRQGADGSSASAPRPSDDASARTPALSMPASTRGWRTACSRAAARPGRMSPRSSRLVPDSTVRVVRRDTAPYRLVLQKKQPVVRVGAVAGVVELAGVEHVERPALGRGEGAGALRRLSGHGRRGRVVHGHARTRHAVRRGGQGQAVDAAAHRDRRRPDLAQHRLQAPQVAHPSSARRSRLATQAGARGVPGNLAH